MSAAKVTKTIKKECFEFWMKLENYGQIPSRLAFEMFQESRISFSELMENVRSDPVVDGSFEGLCEEIAHQQFPGLLPREDCNFFQFLEECLMAQDSVESDREDRENEEKKKELAVLKETMTMISGNTNEVQTHLDFKRKMVRQKPAVGLRIQDHPKWAMWTGFSEEEKAEYKETFWRVYQKNEELATGSAEESVKEMRKRKIQEMEEIETKNQKGTKKRKMVELEEKKTKKAKKEEKKKEEDQKWRGEAIDEEHENEKGVAEMLENIFGDFEDKELI